MNLVFSHSDREASSRLDARSLELVLVGAGLADPSARETLACVSPLDFNDPDMAALFNVLRESWEVGKVAPESCDLAGSWIDAITKRLRNRPEAAARIGEALEAYDPELDDEARLSSLVSRLHDRSELRRQAERESARGAAGDFEARVSTALAQLQPLTPTEVEADEIPEAVVEGWLYRGMTTSLAGGAKQGKGVLSMQAAVCVATGARFLDLETRRGRVLYLCGEMTAAIVRDRMTAIAATLGVQPPDWTEDVLLVAPRAAAAAPSIDLTNAADREAVLRAIQAHRPALVVLDTLHNFAPPSEMIEASMGEVLRELGDVARQSGAAVLVIDHAPKAVTTGEGGSSPATAAYGSVFKGGAVAVTSHLRREGEGWSLAAEGWLPTWPEPVVYRRANESEGSLGCIRSTAAQARGVDLEALYGVFATEGERDPRGGYFFGSKRALASALQATGLVSNSRKMATGLVSQVLNEHAADAASGAGRYTPIVTTPDGRSIRITMKPETVEQFEAEGIRH